MWNDTGQATAAGAVWLLLVTLAFLALRKPNRADPRPTWLDKVTLPALLLATLLVRLLPALWLPVGAGYDIESYRMVTDALLRGQEVYTAALGRHPYLPFQMYILGGMAWLSQATGLPYIVAVKLPSILADVAIVALIHRTFILSGRRPVTAAYFGLLYALNPVALLVVSYHGQFESVTLLLLVASWMLWHFGRRKHGSATALGFAVLNKTWPVIFLPVILMRLRTWRARLLYGLIALGIPVAFAALYLLVFRADPAPMLRRALTHRGVSGFWGPGALLAPIGMRVPAIQAIYDGLNVAHSALLAGGVLLALWWTAKQRALDALLTVILTLFAVTVGFGIQWLLWPIPFALLANEDRWARWFSLAAAAMLFVHLYGLHMVDWFGPWTPGNNVDWLLRLSSLPAYAIVLAWTVDRYRRARAERVQFTTGRETLVQ